MLTDKSNALSIEPGPATTLLAGGVRDAPRGYRLMAVVRDGDRVVIYKAVRTSDDAPVLLKTHRNERPTEREVAQLAHELAVLTRLAGAPVIHALALEESGGRPWLILEDLGGESLNRIAARFRSPARAVALAAKIAGALAGVHRLGVVHRDLKPHHVIVLTDGSIRLTDFRKASLLRVDSAVTGLHGSLAYLPNRPGE